MTPRNRRIIGAAAPMIGVLTCGIVASVPDPGSCDSEASAGVAEYFRILSGPAGDRDWAAFRALFLPGARMDAVGLDEAGENQFYPQSLDEYIAHVDQYLHRVGFFQEPLSTSVECFGRIARARAEYRSTNEVGGAVIDRGTLLFHLVQDGERWRIAHAMWQSRPNPES